MNNKKIKRNLILGATAVTVVAVVIWERRRVNELIAMSQAAVLETMGDTWEEGFKYGFNIAKDNLKELSQTSMEEMYNLGRPLNQGKLHLEEKFPTLSH